MFSGQTYMEDNRTKLKDGHQSAISNVIDTSIKFEEIGSLVITRKRNYLATDRPTD